MSQATWADPTATWADTDYAWDGTFLGTTTTAQPSDGIMAALPLSTRQLSRTLRTARVVVRTRRRVIRVNAELITEDTITTHTEVVAHAVAFTKNRCCVEQHTRCAAVAKRASTYEKQPTAKSRAWVAQHNREDLFVLNNLVLR